MNVLRVKQLSTNKWLGRMDSEKPAAKFKAECAAQFAVAEADLAVVETVWTDIQWQAAAAELVAGSHEGLAVIAQTAPAKTPAGRSPVSTLGEIGATSHLAVVR